MHGHVGVFGSCGGYPGPKPVAPVLPAGLLVETPLVDESKPLCDDRR